MLHKTNPSEFNLSGIHSPETCKGRYCIMHNQAEHHMRDWPLTVRRRGQTVLWERHCEHGVGHPDPSQFDYWDEQSILHTESVHGCDGCCGL